jgi:hypothetical protein
MFLSEWCEYPVGALLCKKEIKIKIYDSSRLDVVEIARVA